MSSFVVSSSVLHLPSLSIGPIPPSADYLFTSSIQSILNPDTLLVLASVYSYDTSLHALAYKPVAKKVCAILAPLDKEFHITQSLLEDLLSGLKPLPSHPPNFIPGVCFTQDCTDNLDLDPANWLWPNEVKLVCWIILEHKMAFAWIPTKHSRLDKRYFPPIKIPTIPHTPWVLQNIPIPLSMWADTIRIIKDQITSGVYEPSAAAYQLHWFCVLKQDGKSLCLVHDLQPLNAVTIQDLSTPPFIKHLAESFARYAVYGMMDLFTGYDQHLLHLDSQDLTTFNSPLGPHFLTIIPMGYTNVVQIYQADMSFILQDEIPHYSYPWINDLPVKSVTTQYKNPDGSYETIPDNPGICCFIWEYLQVVH